MATKANAEAVATFTKDQLLASKRYANRQDILNALLVGGKEYTTEQVDALIEKYMKREVK